MSRRPTEPSKPDKLLWPDAGFSKRDLWEYLAAVGERMLPWFADRPLTLLRHPDGITASGFFQKDLPRHAPDDLDRYDTTVDGGERPVSYLVPHTVADLQWAGNAGAVELHPGSARVDRIDRPDLCTLDLDPGDDPDLVVPAARWLHEILEVLGLESMVKTSGKRGLHVALPLERRYPYDQVRAFGRGIAAACAASHPKELTTEMRKARRGGRLLLDWSRNGTWQTVVGAYSPRIHPAGTVSAPLSWDEVTDDLDPTTLTLTTVPDRGDPWADRPGPQRIETAQHALVDQGYLDSGEVGAG